MYRVWIALAALLGLGAGFVITFLIGINVTGSAECDGMCFDKWDEVSYIAYAIGALTALGSGAAARTALRR